MTVPTVPVKHSVPVKGANLTILLFGPTGAGKTAQIGELAEYLYVKHKQKSRLYTGDPGGVATIKPYIDLGIIQPVFMFGDNPWDWINHACKGDKLQAGKWVPGVDDEIGLYAFEGMTAFADEVMKWMRTEATKGVNIGGQGAINFKAGDVKIGSNNMAHYKVAQEQVYEKSVQSQFLPGIVLWTAGDSRGEDDANGAVVGPQIAGRALTGEAPRWFQLTFRIGVEVLPGGEPKHVLYTDHHIEMAAKGARAIANARVPLSGGTIKIPTRIDPANLVQVIQLLEKRTDAATDEIAKRLGLVR